ncbi:MAG TPA: RNA methyltransferase [Verrucomicrobiae bacterium]|nr:RNA methyltransferase [Verrucomicrobiae bacterium]
MRRRLGAHSEHLTALRALATVKGRRVQGRFAFEGPTLIEEAMAAGLHVEALFATQAALEGFAPADRLETGGAAIYLIEEGIAQKLSGVESPTGLIAIAATPGRSAAQVLAREGVVLLLADLNDPGNAGTLVRSADAFGAAGVLFGRLGVDPYHPKVVRAAMGALFRTAVAVADPADLAGSRRPVTGLEASGAPIWAGTLPPGGILVVGHERRGLGRWEELCERRLSIPICAQAESLNAAVAGSVALYEAARGRAPGTPADKREHPP